MKAKIQGPPTATKCRIRATSPLESQQRCATVFQATINRKIIKDGDPTPNS